MRQVQRSVIASVTALLASLLLFGATRALGASGRFSRRAVGVALLLAAVLAPAPLPSALPAQAQSLTEFDLELDVSPTTLVPGPDGALWWTGENGIGRITSAGLITKFRTSGSVGDLLVGPDGALWFTAFVASAGGSSGEGRIGRITTNGVVMEFPLPAGTGFSSQLLVGPDGALWFTGFTSGPGGPGEYRIGRITTSGVITTFPLPTGTTLASGLLAGPDGALWFTVIILSPGGTNEYRVVGRSTTSGVITTFTVPPPARPGPVVAGPDGALWFTESGASKICRIATNGLLTEYPLSIGAAPQSIAAGPDGALWFTERSASKIGRIATNGAITEYPIAPGADPQGITAGLDGALWFTERDANKIGRITTSGVVTEYPIPAASSSAQAITAGPDGALWFTDSVANKIGRLAVPSLPPVGGHGFTLEVRSSPATTGGTHLNPARVLHWQPGTQTSTLLLRWSPEHGFAFPATLAPGIGTYTDSELLSDPLYCYLAMSYTGELVQPSVQAFSDPLCVKFLDAGLPFGTPPAPFRIGLRETSRATPTWSGPGGQDHYTLVRDRLDGAPLGSTTLAAGQTTQTEEVSSGIACYGLIAQAGDNVLGVTTAALRGVPGVAYFAGTSDAYSPVASTLERLGRTLDTALRRR